MECGQHGCSLHRPCTTAASRPSKHTAPNRPRSDLRGTAGEGTLPPFAGGALLSPAAVIGCDTSPGQLCPRALLLAFLPDALIPTRNERAPRPTLRLSRHNDLAAKAARRPDGGRCQGAPTHISHHATPSGRVAAPWSQAAALGVWLRRPRARPAGGASARRPEAGKRPPRLTR